MNLKENVLNCIIKVSIQILPWELNKIDFEEFLRMFLSYGLCVLIAAAIIAVAVFIGITVRKSKNKKEAMENAESGEAEE